MKILFLLGLGIIALAFLAFRFWPVDDNAYVSDAFNVTPPQKPNYYVNSDEEGAFDISASDLAKFVSEAMHAIPRAKIVAKSDDRLSQTYVVRSLLMGFPDYISVDIKSITDQKSQLKIYSRSRFGYSDLGVNKGRVQQVLSALRAKT